ncbi:hypothetical protein FQN50_004445 [Emmonsiellopsis sp. PD_5]|nr:hypothetical protein FQN50_004445 [Emmonsiellopsis sp. PD_5]
MSPGPHGDRSMLTQHARLEPESKVDWLYNLSQKPKIYRLPAYYDNLSQIYLTTGALRELDRRNNASKNTNPRPVAPKPRRPVTRLFRAELEKRNQRFQFAPDFLRNCESWCVGSIRRLSKHGGPDLSDLRGHPLPESPFTPVDMDPPKTPTPKGKKRGKKRASTSSAQDEDTPTRTQNSTATPYSRNFHQHLINFGIYPDRYVWPDRRKAPQPDNLEDIKHRFARRRPSLSPSRFTDEDFDAFEEKDAGVTKEQVVMSSIIHVIEGEIADIRCVGSGYVLTNLAAITDETISPAKPDRFFGARPEQLDTRVQKHLKRFIVPSTQRDLPLAPNFFLEAKGPDGIHSTARRQACYDGAIGARGMHRLQSYGRDELVYDNNAYTITAVYQPGTLNLYATHPARPTGSQTGPQYFMTKIRSFAITDSPESFREAATWYRNAMDWTKEKRDEFIEAANARVEEVESQRVAVAAAVQTIRSTPAPPADTDNMTVLAVNETTIETTQGEMTLEAQGEDSDGEESPEALERLLKRPKITANGTANA